MKKYLNLSATLIVIFFMSSNLDFAQDISHGSWGISASINNSQADLLFPIWLGNSSTIAPGAGISGISDIYTDLNIGLVYHYYLKDNSDFSPILGGRAGAIIGIPKTGESTTDWVVGILGGGEYFLSRNFSVGIEAQFNLAFSDKLSTRFGNPGGTNFNTGSVIFATVYF